MKKLLFLLIFIPAVAISQTVVQLFDSEIIQEVNIKPAYYDTLGNLYGYATVQVKPFKINIKQVKSSGQWYMEYADASNTVRRKYLGWRTSQKYEGCDIFTNKEQSEYWIWQFNEKKFPYKIEVPEFIINIK